MKTTRKQLNKIIQEEIGRKRSSETYLINEGILDFLGNLFLGMVNFAMAPFGYQLDIAQEVSKEEAIKLWEKQQAAGNTPIGVDKVEDLRPNEDEEHKKWLITAVSGVWSNLAKEASAELDKASAVANWTPADETKEAQEAWKKENGQNAEGLWSAIGKISGLGKYLAGEGIAVPDPSKEGEEAVKTGNPAEAINFSVKALDSYIAWWSGEGSISDRAGEVATALELTKAKFAELGKAVSADAKEEQAEQQNEARKNRALKMSENKLRKTIRSVLMTESASEQAVALLKNEYTVVSEKDAPGIRRDTNRITTYTRNDGQPVPPEDLKLLQDRDAEVRKKGGGMARLMGVYTSSMSPDGKSLIVKYHRTTAG